jgi:DNA-damage-inducible protein J
MKNGVISARIEAPLKESVEEILKELGLTASQAITMFYKQVQLNHGLPFEVKIPNEETIQAMNDAKHSRDMEEVTFDQLKDQLNT